VKYLLEGPEPWKKTYRIRCPECDAEFDATAYFREGDPWPTFVATCPRCDYTILESEWEEI